MTRPFTSVAPTARDRPGDDRIFALHSEALQRSAAGESILNATLGALTDDTGRLYTLPTVLATMARVQESTAGYAPITGLPSFHAAVLDDLYGGTGLAEQAVAITTPGGTGAVYAAVHGFLEPDQRLLVPNFYWGPYEAIATHAGCGLDPFPMFTGEGRFHLEALREGLARHLAHQGRAFVVLNFPCHNPTGYTLDADEWRSITEIVVAAGRDGPVTVLIDAAYMDFAGDAARSWVAAVPALLESTTVLVAWTASKSFTQYGARVGALVALHRDPAECAQIERALGYSCRGTWSTSNHAGQRAVTELLTDHALRSRVEGERAEAAALLAGRIQTFNALAAEAGLPIPRYEAGFFVTVLTPHAEAVAARMREEGVYGVPVGDGIRLALCSTPVAAIPRLVEAVEGGLAAEAPTPDDGARGGPRLPGAL